MAVGGAHLEVEESGGQFSDWSDVHHLGLAQEHVVVTPHIVEALGNLLCDKDN